ncbi:Ig-like domain-containing protein [Maricaulis sp.]|uniref:Ig-like domain-containing protein n=1 Tax=Maricaulis sp. TaxID=1486257 RepID=UPI002636E97D|nr:Ig-like domain-containing protein [Maricaulis sp.]
MLSLDQFKAVVNSTGKVMRSFALAGAGAMAMASGAQAQAPTFISVSAQEFPSPNPFVLDIRPGESVRLSYQFFSTDPMDFDNGEFTVFLDSAIPLAAAQAGTFSVGCDDDGVAAANGGGTVGFTGLAESLPAFQSCVINFNFQVPLSTSAGTYTITHSDLTGIADPDGAATPFSLAIPDVDVIVSADTGAPTPEITGPGGPVSAPFNVSIGFTDAVSLTPEQVNGFDVSDLDVTNATVALASGGGGDGGGAIFSAQVEVTPTGGTPITVQLPATTVTDNASNDNVISNLYTVAYDASPPVDPADQVLFTSDFIGDPVAPGGTATHRFTINNTSAEDLTITFFTENIQASLTGLAASGPVSSDTCGGTLSGTTFLIYTGGSVLAGQSCVIEVPVTAPIGAAGGIYPVATSSLSVSLATTGPVVIDPAVSNFEVAGAEGTGTIDFSKEFTNDPAGPGDQVTLEFTITAAGSFTTTGLSFTDDLDATLSGLVSSSGTQTDVCGTGSSLSGTSLLTLTGGNLGQDESCTFTVTVDVPGGATAGDYVNTTSTLAATRSDVGAVTIAAATDTLDIDVPAPTSRIEGPNGPLSVASNFTVDLIFNEDVTGVDASDFTLTGVTLIGITPVDAANYTVEFTPTGVGTAEIQYNAAGAQNGGGADNTASNNFTVAIATAAPEATTLGVGVEIVNGDTTPGAGDGTFIGTADVAGGTATRTFTIRNDGTTDLTVGTVSLVTGTDFSITSQPSSPVAAGNSTTFEVTFDPAALGSSSDTLSFATNDADENPYTFAVSGSGVSSPEINVADSGATINILNGDVTPAVADGTDFGTVNIDSATPTATFTIQNLGSADLTLGSNPVSITGSSDFTVTTQPASTIAAAGSSTFVVTFDPSEVGEINASVSIANNDGDENPYTFGLTGSGFDNAAPSGYTVAFDQTGYGPSNNTSASFTVSDPELLADYSYSVSSSGGGTPLTGSGTVPTPGAGSPNEFQITGLNLSGLSEGTVTVSVTLTDPSGNAGTAATDTAPLDLTQPTVTITNGSVDPVSGAFTATFTFSESVTGFVVGDITPGNAALSGFSGSGDTYTATVTPSSDGAVTLDVAAGVAADQVGNTNTAATQFSVTNDQTPPTVTVSSTTTGPTNAAFTVDIVFSESVADFVVGDINASAELSLSGFSGSGTTYSVTATPIADGSATVDVNAGVASDAAGNGNTAATQFGIDVDITAPTGFTVGFAGFDTGSFNATSAPNGFFDFTGAEVGTTYDYSFTSDAGGSPVTGSGSITSAGQNISPIDLSGLPDGTLTLSVTLTDAAGNVSTPDTATATLDQDGPSVTITGPTATQTGAFTIDVVFSEAVTGFDVSDLNVGNGAASGFTGSGTTYQATITPAADGAVTVDIALGAGQDAVSNPSEAATQFSVDADITPPTVAFTGPTAIQSGPFNLTIDFSEDVTGFAAIDVDVVNGVLSAFSGSGDSWTAEVTPTAEGTLTVDIPAGRLTDIAGNGNTAAPQFSVDTDLTPPDVIIASVATGVQTGPFDVSFTFSEAVTGFELSDITVGNGAASAFTGSGTTYGATITPAADGAVTVDVAADVATDGPGNGNTAATQFSLDADVSAPTVESVVASDALLGVADVGTPFTLAVTFSEAMDPTTVPAIDFGSDDLSGTLTFTTGAFSSGDTVYTATYAVADNGDNISDIDVTVTGGADANGNAQTDGTETDIFSVDMRRGTVTIATSITGAADGTFDYTGDLGDFSMTTVAQAGSSIFNDLAEGSYAVVLDDFGDFTLDAIMCTGGSTTVDTGTGTANITLSPADNVSCDFEFTADPKIDEAAIPDVEITFASLTDDPTTESTTFSLDNTGGAAFFFTAATDQPWLTIDPTSGSIPAAGSLEFTVSFTAAVLDLAPGTYSANITITEVVPSGQDGGLAKANTLDTIVIPVTITLEPREGSLTIVATTAPSIAGEGSFSYASDITAVNGLTLNTSNGTASSAGFTVLRGTYAISQAANAEWDLSAITCTGDTDGGNVVDLANGTITIDLDPEETMVCTFANVRNEAYIQEVTLSAIRSFMAARADQILTNSPRLAQRMRSGDEATTPNHFSADFRDGRFQANFSTSLNAIRAANQKSSPTSDSFAAANQGGVGSTDIWFQATYSSVDDNRAGLDAESDFGIYYLGADMMVSENVLVGALVQWDTAETVTGALRSRVEGDGWMAGPYVVARLSENMYFDARGAYGQSDNQVNPIGTYWDDFETDRWLLEANLTGDYFAGGWRISPEIGLAYFTEEQSAYTDSLGFTIPSQDITIGRLNFGPEFAYRMDNPNGGYFEPFIRFNGVWDYDDADVYNANGVLTSLGDFRADARFGFNAELSNGGILSGEVSVQGVGESDLDANSAMIRVRLPLSMQ